MSQTSQPPGSHAPAKYLVILAFTAIYLIWGSTYVAIAVAIQTIPPFLMAGSRFLIAGLVLYVWCRFNGQSTPGTKALSHISISGILMLFCGTGAVVWVEQYIPSSLAAIIVATVPLWFVLLDKYQWKFHFGSRSIIVGLLIGFVGVILLFADRSTFSLGGDKMKAISFFVLLAGTIFWSVGSLYSKYKPVKASPAIKAAIQMTAAGVMSMLLAFLLGEHHRILWDQISVRSIIAWLYLIIGGSLIGFMSYIWLLSHRPPALVGTYAYVNPVVAVFLGWLIASEKVNVQQIIALVVILGGVVLVNLSKKN